MKSAAIYARVSSDKQKQENTIESQINEVIEFSQSKGFSVCSELIFRDDGYSGSNLRRPGLEQLRDVLQEGRIEVIFTYAPDRIARNYVHQEILREEFKKLGVELYFVKSPPANTPEERLTLQFQGILAEYERELITERTRRGRKHRAKAGCVSVLSSAPFGYRYVKKTAERDAYYEIIEHESEVVRMVFELYTKSNMALSSIVRHLQENKITKRKGSCKWTRSVLRVMLRNPAYAGTACYGKTTKKERPATPVTRRNNATLSSRSNYKQSCPKDSWIPIPVPAIVDKATFDMAQECLESNKKFSPRSTKEPSLLQGLLVCELCGRSYVKRRYKYGDKIARYYACIGSIASKIEGMKHCKNKLIRQDSLDDAVWEHVIQLLKDPDIVRKEIERRVETAKNDRSSDHKESGLRKELIRFEKAANALLDAYQEGLVALEELRERMPQIRQRKKAIEKQLESILIREVDRDMLARVSLNVDSFLKQLSKNQGNLTIQEKQRIIRLIIKQVTVGEKKGDERDIVITHCVPVKEKWDGITDENLQLCTGRVYF